MTWSNLLGRNHQGCCWPCCGGKVRLSHHRGPKAERVFESGSWWAGDPLGQPKKVVFTLPVLPLGPGVPSSLAPGVPFSPLGPGTPSHRQEMCHFTSFSVSPSIQAPFKLFRCWSHSLWQHREIIHFFKFYLGTHSLFSSGQLPMTDRAPASTHLQLKWVKMEIFHRETHSARVNALAWVWGPLPRSPHGSDKPQSWTISSTNCC